MSSAIRILIVDDEPELLTILSQALRASAGAGFEVETATSGEEALERLSVGRFHIVLADYKLPGINGAELLSLVQRYTPDTQRVLMSAFPSAAESGATETVFNLFMPKPFSLHYFRETLRGLASPLAEPTKPRVLVLEDNDGLRRLFRKSLTIAGYEVDEAASVGAARWLLDGNRYALFLCDIRVGDEFAVHLLAEYRAHLSTQGTQVIMVSGETHYREMCEELGADFFMEKPVAIPPLITLVQRLYPTAFSAS